jgi:Family of unknown function (DUF5999)
MNAVQTLDRSATLTESWCRHQPPCPTAEAPDRGAARVVAAHPEQGWSLLCNGVVSFDDTGQLLPDGRPVPPQRGPARHAAWAVGLQSKHGWR